MLLEVGVVAEPIGDLADGWLVILPSPSLLVNDLLPVCDPAEQPFPCRPGRFLSEDFLEFPWLRLRRCRGAGRLAVFLEHEC
jgi:hypothetical protein